MKQPPRKFTAPAMVVLLGAALFGGIAIGSSMPRDEHTRTVVVHATATPEALTFTKYEAPCKALPIERSGNLIWLCPTGAAFSTKVGR